MPTEQEKRLNEIQSERFREMFRINTTERDSFKLVENPMKILPKYSPVENEEGLFYRMDISTDSYFWKVADREDGSERMFMGNAFTHSLKDIVKKFKEEFYGE